MAVGLLCDTKWGQQLLIRCCTITVTSVRRYSGCFARLTFTEFFFLFKKQCESSSLPMPQRHPRSFPDCPTRIRGWLGQFERGSGTARSPSLDRRLFSASCHSAALAQSGTGVSHSADKADKAREKTQNITLKHVTVDMQSLSHICIPPISFSVPQDSSSRSLI